MNCKHILLTALALAGLTACTSGGWCFDTDYFRIRVNRQGYITSMRNITTSPACEFSPQDRPSPLLSLYDSGTGTFYTPQTAIYDEATRSFSLTYSNGSVANVTLLPRDKYFRLTLNSLEPRNGIDAVQWGTYYTNITNLLGEIIGVARDTSEAVNYSIGVLALDDNTLGGTPDIEGDAAPFEYIIHSPDSKRFPLPDSLHEGQHFSLGGDGISDVAFYANKEPYYRIMYGNAAQVDSMGRIFLNYQSRDRSRPRQVLYSLIPHMPANLPNHIDVEPVPDVDFIGSSVALWGSPDSTALLDVIQDIVINEQLPYPTLRGRWIKDPAAYAPDVLTSGNRYDSIISYTRQMGLPSIHAYDQGFLRPDRANNGYLDGPNHTGKPFRLTSGNLSHREYADLAATDGILLGRTSITNSLAPGTLDASPVPSDSLCSQQRRVLAADVSATDTAIVVDDPTYLDEIASWEGHCSNLNMVKIGKELIHYMGVSKTAPYTLQNVTRGYWGTVKQPHAKGDVVEKLQVTVNYGYDGIIPNLALQDRIAEYYAEVSRKCGIALYDFDGQEFLFNNGHGYYSAKRFFRRMFKHATELGVPYLRISGATLSEGSWHYQSIWNIGGGTNMYDLNTREWGSSTSQGKDMRDVTYSNFFPVSFGNNFPIGSNSTVEQYEHIEAISVGFGATYFMRISQDAVESCPQKYRIFRAIHTWESARRANAFPRQLRKLLMRPEYDWHLEPGDDADSWVLHRMENGRSVQTYDLHRAVGY